MCQTVRRYGGRALKLFDHYKDDAIKILAVLTALATFFVCGVAIWIYESLTE